MKGLRTAMKSGPRAAMKSGPHLPQLEKALARTKDPAQPKIKKKKKKKFVTVHRWGGYGRPPEVSMRSAVLCETGAEQEAVIFIIPSSCFMLEIFHI